MADTNAIRAGKAAVEISGDDQKLKEATDRSKKYLADIGKAAKETSQEGEKGFLQRLASRAKELRKERRTSGESALERALGSGGGMTQMAAQSLGMGLPVMITEQIGRGLEEGSAKMLELNKQLREGKITSEEMVRGFATGIPVLGSWVGFFLNIREMLTGEKQEIEEINQATARQVAITDSLSKAARTYHDTLRDINAEARKTVIATAAIGRGGFYGEAASIAAGRVDLEKRREDGGKAAADKLQQEMEPALKAMREEVAAAEMKLAHTSGYAKKKTAQEEVDAAKARLKATLEQLQGEKDKIKEATGKGIEADAGKLDTQAADLAKRYAEEWARAEADADKAIGHSRIAAAADRLRRMGQEGEAEKALLQEQQKEREETIRRAAEEEAKRFGAIDPNDPRRVAILQRAQGLIYATQEETAAKQAEIDQRTYEKKRKLALELEEITAQGIANAHQREMAELDAKYKAELDIAQRAGRDTAQIKEKWAQDCANKEQAHALQVADAQRDMDSEIARARLHLSGHGLKQRLAELEMERREALRKEMDPRTTTGVGTGRINALYDLKAREDLQHSVSAAGSFSARELSRMGGEGGHLGQIAQATKETARNTRRLTQQKPAFSAG